MELEEFLICQFLRYFHKQCSQGSFLENCVGCIAHLVLNTSLL